MEAQLESTINALQARFGAQPGECKVGASLIVPPENIIPVAQALRDEFGFDFLSDETASDYWPEESPRFHVVYQFYSNTSKTRLCVRVPVDGNQPVLPSVVPLFPNADWHEREIWDMFGIRFDGHPDLRRILMPYDWEGHPLRKDYPLGYEEPQFTFNYEDIQVRKHRGRIEEA
jgi:NADH-quinone oxidoreductase subunit C